MGSVRVRSSSRGVWADARAFVWREFFLLSIIKKNMCDCPDESMLLDGYEFDSYDRVELRLTEDADAVYDQYEIDCMIAHEYEMEEQEGRMVDTRSKNAIKCSTYYRKDPSAQKRRVIINGMKHHGRLPALRTVLKWGINIYKVIECYEHLKQKDPEKWDKINLRARALVANML